MAEVNGIYAHNITYDYSGDTGAEAACGVPSVSGALGGNDSIVFSGASATYEHEVTFSNSNPKCSVSPSSHTVSVEVEASDMSFFAGGAATITTTYDAYGYAPVLELNQSDNGSYQINSGDADGLLNSAIYIQWKITDDYTDPYPGNLTYEIFDNDGSNVTLSGTPQTPTAHASNTYALANHGIPANSLGVGTYTYTIEVSDGSNVGQGTYTFTIFQQVFGCTDASACNYDVTATDDDGSCIPPVQYYRDSDGDGFIDVPNEFCGSPICSGDPIPTYNSQNCQPAGTDSEEYGCTDVLACNYDATATEDNATCYYSNDANTATGGPDLLHRNCDGTCINDSDGDGICDEYEIVGCTDPGADNYDATATDDGTCQYIGCTDVAAQNYGIQTSTGANLGSTINVDDGSCDYGDDPTFGTIPSDVSVSIPYNQSTYQTPIDLEWTGIADDTTLSNLNGRVIQSAYANLSSPTTLGTEVVGSDAAISYTIPANTLTSGTYYYGLELVDENGNVVTSNSTKIYIIQSSNTQPGARITYDNVVYTDNDDITLSLDYREPSISQNFLANMWDPTSGTISGEWIFTNPTGTTTAVASNGSNQSFTLLNDEINTLTLKVISDEGLGMLEQSVSITLNINVIPTVNTAPTGLYAGDDHSYDTNFNDVNYSGNITLPGPNNTQPTDADGDPISYVWEKSSGPTVSINNPTDWNASITDPPIGVYQFKVSATDNYSTAIIDTVQITIVGLVDDVPIVDAGNDATVIVPFQDGSATHTITGATITDEDDDYSEDLNQFTWSILGNDGGVPVLTGATTLAPTFIGLTGITYTLTLTLNQAADANINWPILGISDTVVITFDEEANTAPEAEMVFEGVNYTGTTNNVTVNVPYLSTTENYNFIANVDDDTPGSGPFPTYEWKVNGSVVDTTQNPTLTLNSTNGYINVIILTVTDSGNLTSSVGLNVTTTYTANTPPTALIYNNGGDVTNTIISGLAPTHDGTAGGMVEINLNGSNSSDPDGTSVTGWEWRLGTYGGGSWDTSGFISAGVSSLTYSSLEVGQQYRFWLRVSSDGQNSNPVFVDIDTIGPEPNAPPVANLTISPSSPIVFDETTPYSNVTFTLDASTSYDPDGDPLDYRYSIVNASSGYNLRDFNTSATNYESFNLQNIFTLQPVYQYALEAAGEVDVPIYVTVKDTYGEEDYTYINVTFQIDASQFGINNPPVFDPSTDAYLSNFTNGTNTINEGGSFSIPASNIETAIDPENSSITYGFVSTNNHIGMTYNSSTSTYTLSPIDTNWCGTEFIKFTATDEVVGSDTGGAKTADTTIATITVNCILDDADFEVQDLSSVTVDLSTPIEIDEREVLVLNLDIDDPDSLTNHPNITYEFVIAQIFGSTNISAAVDNSINQLTITSITDSPSSNNVVQLRLDKYDSGAIHNQELKIIPINVLESENEPQLSLSSGVVNLAEDGGSSSTITATVDNLDNKPITWGGGFSTSYVDVVITPDTASAPYNSADIVITAIDDSIAFSAHVVNIDITYDFEGSTKTQTVSITVDNTITYIDPPTFSLSASTYDIYEYNGVGALISDNKLSIPIDISDDDPNETQFKVFITFDSGYLELQTPNDYTITSEAGYNFERTISSADISVVSGKSIANITIDLQVLDVEISSDTNTAFGVKVKDSSGLSSTSSAFIVVKPVNDPHTVDFSSNISLTEIETSTTTSYPIVIADNEGVDDFSSYSFEIDDNNVKNATYTSTTYAGNARLTFQMLGSLNLLVTQTPQYCGNSSHVLKVSDADYDVSVPFNIEVTCTDDKPDLTNLQPQYVLDEDFVSPNHSITFDVVDDDVTDIGGFTHTFEDITANVQFIDTATYPPKLSIIGTPTVITDTSTTGKLTITFQSIPNENSGADWLDSTIDVGKSKLEISLTGPGSEGTSVHNTLISIKPINDAPIMNIITPLILDQGETSSPINISATDADGNDTIQKFQLSFTGDFDDGSVVDIVNTGVISTTDLTVVGGNGGNGSGQLTITATSDSTFSDNVYVRACDDIGCGDSTYFFVDATDIYLGYTFEIVTNIEDVGEYLTIDEEGTHPAGIPESESFDIYGNIVLDSGNNPPNWVDFLIDVSSSDYYTFGTDIGYFLAGAANVKITITPDQNAIIENQNIASLTVTVNDQNVGGIKTDDIDDFILLYEDCDGNVNGNSVADACGNCGGTCFDVGSHYGFASFVLCLDESIDGSSGSNLFGECMSSGAGETGFVWDPSLGDWSSTASIITIFNTLAENYGQYSLQNHQINLDYIDDTLTIGGSSPTFPDLTESLDLRYYAFTQPDGPFLSESYQIVSYSTDIVECCYAATDSDGVQIFADDGSPLCSDEEITVNNLGTGTHSEDLIFDFANTCPSGLIESAPFPVVGCTNSDADNYDSDANIDDGSCAYVGAMIIESSAAFGLYEDLNIYIVGGDIRENYHSEPNQFTSSPNPNFGGFMPTELITPYSFNQSTINSENTDTDSDGDVDIHDVPHFDKPSSDFDIVTAGIIHPKVGCRTNLPGTTGATAHGYKYTLTITDYNTGTPTELFVKEFRWTNNPQDRSEFNSFLNREFVYSLPKSGYYNFKLEFEVEWPYAQYLSDQTPVTPLTPDMGGIIKSTTNYPSGLIIGRDVIPDGSTYYIHFSAVSIQQSLSDIYLPFQGINISVSDYPTINYTYYTSENTPYFNQDFNANPTTWVGDNQDTRKPLGCFNYNDDNQLQGEWLFDKLGDKFQELLPENIITSDALEHQNTFDYTLEAWKIPHVVDVDIRMYKRRGVSDSTLFHYWDKDLHPDNYDETAAPLDVQFYFYPRPSKSPLGGSYPFALFEYKDENLLMQDFKNGFYYLALVDWGDGSTIEYDKEPLRLGFDVIARHNYERAGIYEITGYMMRVDLDELFEPAQGIVSNTKFLARININPERENEFEYLGGTGYSFIPYQDTTPVIGGISNDSLYYNSISRQLGFLENGDDVNTYFEKYSDRLNSENALYLINETQPTTEIQNYQDAVVDVLDGNNLIFNGLYNEAGELGSSIGFTDIQLPRFFNEPKPMWEMLGFEDNVTGNPSSPRYWNNIIPEYYDIYTNRYGMEGEEQLSLDILLMVAGVLNLSLDETSLENQLIYFELCPNTGCDEFWLGLIENTIADFVDSTQIMDTISSEENLPYYDEDGDDFITVLDITAKVQKLKGGNFDEGNWNVANVQSWVGDYYYPVIPKFNMNGSFSNDLGDKIPFGTSGRAWNEDDTEASITNEQYQDNSLLLNYTSEYLDKGVLEDTSGYDNIGMCMNDYRLEYDEQTIEPIKKNRKFKLNRGKTNKAF